MTKLTRMRSDVPQAELMEDEPTPWLVLAPAVAFDTLLFAVVHLNDTLWQWGLALSHVTLRQ